jgi:hypothetical protein
MLIFLLTILLIAFYLIGVLLCRYYTIKHHNLKYKYIKLGRADMIFCLIPFYNYLFALFNAIDYLKEKHDFRLSEKIVKKFFGKHY